MAGKNRIDFQLGFTVDKSGLEQMQSLFQQIANKAKEPGNQLNTGLQQAAKTATTLDGILEKTFNTELGSLNVTKFNQEMSKAGLTLKGVKSDLSNAGNQGATAFNRLSQAILGTNLQLKQSNQTLDKMFVTLKNTIRYGISSSLFNNVVGAIEKAYSYSRDLNTSLNDIRIVTDKSAESMAKFAEEANSAAKGLGASTLDYTNASLIYYQQGLADAEVQARAETTLKAANITGQSAAAVSEQLTAVQNGYKVSAEETELYVDKLAAVAATTAADLEELSTGMSKVASAANAMGVDFDDLNAQIATIVSVTRQAPESVGTALKTIYARLGDLKVDGIDEFGVKLGEVSSQLQTMGIQILDQNGNMRDMTSIMAEVADKWNTWTEAQRQAAAVAMAGKRQYNNLVALFDNWDMYSDALETSADAMGILQHQQDIYMESTEAKLQKLRTTWQELYGDLIDTDELNSGIEAITNLVKVFDNFIASFGGGLKSIAGFGAILANVFNKQISESIIQANQRAEVFKQNLNALQVKKDMIDLGKIDSSGSTMRDQASAENTKIQLEYAKQIYDVRVGLNSEEYNNLTLMQQELGQLVEQVKYSELATVNKEKSILGEEKALSLLTEEQNIVQNLLDETAEQYDIQLKEVSAQEKLVNKLDEQVQRSIDLRENTRAQGGYKTQILRTAEQIGDEEQKAVSNILNGVKAGQINKNIKEQILAACSKQYEKESGILTKIEAEMEAEQRVLDVREQNAQLKDKEINLQQELNNRIEQASKNINITQIVTGATSALGNMAMAQSSVQSVMETLNDDTASFDEKVTRIMMTLGMAIPMIISSFSKLNEAFGITNGLFASFELLSKKQAAISALSAAGISLETKALKSKTAEEQKDLAVEELIKKNQAILNGQRVTTIAGLSAEQKALILDDATKKKLTITTLELKAAQDGLNASLLKNPIVAIISILAIAVAAYAKYTKSVREAVEAQKESCKTDIESTKEKYKEIESNKKVYDSYMNLYKLYKENKATKEEVTEATKDLADKYNIEINKLDELSGKYDKYTSKLKRARTQELNNIKQSLSDTKSTAVEEMQASSILSKNIKKGSGKDQYNAIIKEGFTNLDTADKELYKRFNQRQDLFNNYNGRFSVNLDFSDPDKAIETYDKLVKFKEELDNTTDYSTRAESAYYQNLKGIIEDLSESVEHYKEIQSDIYNIDAQMAVDNVDFYNVENLKDFISIREGLIDSLEEEIGDREKAIELIDNYIEEQSDASKSLLDQSEITSEIAKQTKQKVEDVISQWDALPETKKQLILTGKVDLSKAFSTEAIEYEIDKATKNLGTYDVTESVSLAATLASGNKLKKADNQALQNLESDTSEAMAGFDEKGVNHQLEAIDEITQYRIDKNAEYLKDYEGTIQKEIDITLKEKQKIYANDDQYDKAQKFYAEHRLELTEAARREEEYKLNAYKELLEKEKELNDLKEEGLSFNEIEDVGFNSLIADLDMVVNRADLLKSASELIGDGFKVAASDVEKFSNMFPELLENMTVLSDGSIKLDKEILNEKLGSIQEEIEARTQAKIIEVDQQIQLKEAEQSYLKEKLDALTGYLNGTKTQQESVDQIHKAGQEYQKTLMDITGQEISELTNFSIESAGKEGTAYIEMLNQVGEAFAKAANAHYAMINGEQFDQGEGVSFSGITSSAEEFAFSAGQDAINRLNENAELYNNVFNAAKEAQEQYNTVTGELDTLRKQRAILESSVKAAGNAVNRAKSGKAGKESKSSGGKDKKKDQKEQDDEFDRYWQIKKAIDMVDKAISRLDKDQENLHGKELIASLKQENQLLQEQAKNYETLYEMQKQEAEELRAQLSTMGLAFDANGAITNYAAATSAALAQYAQAVEQYNAGLIDETTFKVFEKSYENFKKLLERYDALYYTEMQDTQDKLDEMRRKQLENNLKAWEVEIQLRLDTTKAQREQNDFLKDIKQDFRKVQTDLTIDSSFDRDNFKEYMKDVDTTLKAIKDVEAEIDKMMNGGESDMFESVSQAQEKLKELQEQLLEQGKALYELYKALQQNYINGMDQVKDKFDELMKRYKHLDNELNFQKELVELIYGDKAYDLMDKYYETQEHNIEAQIDSLRQQSDFWQEQFNESYELAKKTGADVNLDDQTTWTEDMKKAYDNMIQSQEDLNDLVLEGVKNLQNQYLNSINEIIDTMEKGLWGMSTDDMKKDQEFFQKIGENFLDDVQKAYKVQNFANRIDQDISKTSNLKAQQKLMTLREQEISYLREKENLTQEDINLAEARYEIALKEIALEDAQNNKTTMKLTRNEQGNQSYQYVADEDDVAAKQQDLTNSLGDYYEKARQYTEEGTELVMDLTQSMQDELRELQINCNGDMDTYNAESVAIYNKYQPYIQAAAENTASYQQEMIYATSGIFRTVNQQDADFYATLNAEQQRLVQELQKTDADGFNELRKQIIEGYYPDLEKIATTVLTNTATVSQTVALQMATQQAADDGKSFKAVVLKAIESMTISTKKYQDKLDELQKVADIDFSKIGDAIDKVDKKINDMNDDTKNLTDDSSNYLDELRKLLEEVAEAWKEVSEKIQNAKQDMDDYAQATREAKAAEQQLGNPPSSPGGPTSNSNSGDGGPGSPSNNGKTEKIGSKKVSPTADGNQSTIYTSTPSGKTKIVRTTDKDYKEYNVGDLQPFRTGGYTGEQADDGGRLAVLHQKELVLNADDTKNFLSGINTIRDLTALNGSISNAIISAVAGMAMNLAGISPGISGQGSGTAPAASNTYNITAEFPNAYSAEEIKQAILGLPNYASQYVNRNVI